MKYELGKTYYISYWQKQCTVLAVNGDTVAVQWVDGHITTHSTPLDKRDKLVS